MHKVWNNADPNMFGKNENIFYLLCELWIMQAF
jgi:hypothetical protein